MGILFLTINFFFSTVHGGCCSCDLPLAWLVAAE